MEHIKYLKIIFNILKITSNDIIADLKLFRESEIVLIEEIASVLTNCATEIVSTMVYSPMKIIITMVGK